MNRSEALTLVAVLQAAFPHFTGGEPTAHLFAERLTRYDHHPAVAGVEAMIENRRDTRWPSWAEVADAIKAARPRYVELQEVEPEPLPASEVKRYVSRLFKAKAMPRIGDDPAEVAHKIALAREALKETA